MSKYKAVIFDLDGTILDTLGDLADSVNYALLKNGLSPREEIQIQDFVGHGVKNLVERSFEAGGGNLSDGDLFEQVYVDFSEYYSKNLKNRTVPYPGTMDMVNALRAAGMKTAIVSNKRDWAVQDLKNHFFTRKMDYALGERDDIERKPAPDMVYAALLALSVTSGEALYIGDSPVDAETAENAGMDYVIVTWGFGEPEDIRKLRPMAFADTNQELLDIILG